MLNGENYSAKLTAGRKLYVAQIIPLRGYYANINLIVIDCNSRISPLVAQKVAEGKPVYCVGMYIAITCSELVDGVHPSRTGCEKMADVWFADIQNDFQW